MTNDKSNINNLIISKGRRTLKPKSDTFSPDATDLRILEALQEDARQTYTDIGKRLGIAHSTVYDRIKRMEQNGIVKKYTTIIDTEKMGVRRILALMTVYTDPKESERVAQKLSESPEVLEAYTSLSEELLIIAKVTAEDQDSLHAFIANSVAPLPGVLRIRTSIITRKFKETPFSVVGNLKKSTFIKRSHDIKGRKKHE
jgi:Lrp/AsnC family transcriptional regulator for asnA, asnC and gidA